MACNCDTQTLLADIAAERIADGKVWEREREALVAQVREAQKEWGWFQDLAHERYQRICKLVDEAKALRERVDDLEAQRQAAQRFFGIYDTGGKW